ncbi:hypothetical protein LUZ60_006777 [Juncus effusus]|nr:hypothetical protein LUZ60_006777 [Juncus effusus]
MLLFILKLLFFFLVSCALGWVFFVITTQLVIIILRRLMGISIGYRMVQLNCIKDVTIFFKKGMIESISIGEMKLDFTNFIMKLGTGDPKIELLISDLSVVLRPKSPNQSSKKKIKNPRKKSSSSGGQKEKILLILAKFTSFWSISIFDITLKDPKAVVGVREFKIDLHKCKESDKFFRFQIQILPILFQITNPDLLLDQQIRFSQVDQLVNGQTCSNSVQCDEFSVNCEFGRSKGKNGIKIRDLDIKCGNISVKSNESLLAKKNQSDNVGPTGSENSVKSTEIKSDKNKSNSSQSKLSSLKKKLISFPDKVSFNIPKIDVRFAHQVHSISVHNNITGISLTGQKSTLCDESAQEDLTRIGLNLDFSEIHILKDDTNSVLEILKVAASASLDIPNEELAPIRAETDVKFGGTKCNLMVHKLVPLLSLKPAKKPKPLVLSEKENNNKNISEKEIIEQKPKLIMWSLTGSAPELTIVLFTTENSPLLHVCSQSTHIFANNFAKNVEIHGELGELNINMSGEFQHTIKEKYLEIKTDKSSLLHITKIRADIGKKETESDDSVTSLEISQMDVNLCFQHLERILFTVSSFKSLIKKTLPSTKKSAQNKSVGSSKNNSGKKGAKKIMKLSLDRCFIKYFDEMSIQDMIVQDPKRVNYGSQGGRVLITTCNDGTPRVATIFATQPSNCDKIKFCTSFEILNLNLCMNKEKRTTQVELERARSKYKELLEGKKEKEESKLTLFDMKNAKFVQRSNDKDSCSLLNITDISIKWKPDPHLALFESFMKVKSVMYKIKIQNPDSEIPQDQESGKTEIPEKEIPKKSVFAIDIEKLKLAAELADGVEAVINVQTIFSENAKIGVLLEGLELGFNCARVFRTSRIQVSRIPVSMTCHITTLDWVVQARDVNICLPYRLEIRAIDDAVEDTIRCLKLLSSAKSDFVFPEKKTIVKKVKPVKNRSTKVRFVRFMIKELVGEIEEEPIQGWLDEHYHLLKNEICEATNRLNQLDESSSKEDNSNNNSSDGSSKSSNEKAREEIYKRTFSSYYNACKKLPSSNGSGSCPNGSFQSGFKFSENRKSVFSVKLKDVDLSLSAIEGGEEGMIRFIKSVDLYCEKNEVPFGKFYGCNLNLTAGSLIAQIRDYTYPLLAATAGKCDGCIVLAQQATYFQPQILQDVFVGKYWKVRLFRSASGTTPPVKFYSNLPIHFQKGELSFGVGYEPVFADISYAFSVALRRAVLGKKTSSLNEPPPRKEKSLPWWDDMRNYIHGINSLYFNETHWHLLASIDPYEKNEKIDFLTSYLEVQQRDGRVSVEAKNIEAHLSSLYTLVKNSRLNIPSRKVVPFIKSPSLFFEIDMEWQCESREPTNHFLHAFPNEGKTREKVLDPFRSTSLSLKWGFSLKPSFDSNDVNTPLNTEFPTFNMAAHDLAWLIKWWNMVYLPPQKLRMFSRWPRFKVPRIVRSGNLPLDKVMTENFIRFESTPTCINYVTLRDDDSAHGLSFRTAKLKYEMCFGRGKYEQYYFDSKRETMDLVYQALDLHSLKGNINNTNNERHEKYKDEGFLLYSEYITIRRQAPKADPIRLLMWREATKSRNNNDLNDKIKSEFDNECDDDREPSDLSDDDGFNVVVADNCQRIYVYGLRILWNLENRNAVFSWVGAMSKAFEPAKPSPSRVYAQRKLSERREKEKEGETGRESDPVDGDDVEAPHSPDRGENIEFNKSSKVDVPSGFSPVGKGNNVEAEKEQETKHFIVNVIAPQFNLHSEEANGRFLLAAASGKVLLHSFHSILHVGYQLIAQALSNNTNTNTNNSNTNNGNTNTNNNMTWSRSELVIMLEHVQAHVAPTDVDPGAGLQWLPKILKKSEVKRTGALLERVFTPCEMFFRYTRHKGGPELKVKPLKELTFNSPSIAASMTSRQFQVMMDVLTNLLLARSPKPQNNYLTYPSEEEGEDNEDSREEESDEVVPDGIEEVELAKIKLEKRDRETKVLIDDIRTLSSLSVADVATESGSKLEDNGSNNGTIVLCSRPLLIQGLKKELEITRKLKKEAISELRETIGKVVQVKLIEKEKNKSPSYAMRISMKIEKVVWSMLIDGKSFAETEINDMVYDFDRDFRDKGVSNFTTKSVVIKNCLQNAKSNTLLSAWNPPPEWGKNVMVRINSKQGAPKDGSSPIESFLVDIYPLKIHLTESMYRMMWEYFFPDEEQHSHKRQEVWKVSTIAGTRKVKKTVSAQDSSETSSHFSYESSTRGDSSHGGKSQKGGLNLWGSSSNSITKSELRRTSSFDQATWEETIADSVANEIVKQATNQKSSQNISKNENLNLSIEQIQDVELAKSKSKDSKRGSQSGRAPRDDSKKVVKPRKLTEFQSFKISQVELLLTYEGSLAVKDLRLLMDTFHRENFTGTWTRLFGRVKKHIVLGVFKSVMGMQGKKFKDKSRFPTLSSQPSIPASLSLSSSSDDDLISTFLKKQSSDQGAGEGFVTAIKGLFGSQRKKAKKLVLRTMRGDGDQGDLRGKMSDGEAEFSPFARQLTITKARKLIRQHTKKLTSRNTRKDHSGGNQDEREAPRESVGYDGDFDFDEDEMPFDET